MGQHFMKLSVKMALAAKDFAIALATVLLAVLLGVLAHSIANASTLTNDTITAEYDRPTLGSNQCTTLCFNPITFKVDITIESSGHVGRESIDFSDHALTITFIAVDPNSNLSANFAASTFNGFLFAILLGNPFDPVASVSGIASSRVSEPNDHQLAINMQGLTFNVGDQIVISFANVNETPVPSALPLFATGLGALGLLGWRRKKKAAAAA